jgi:hypothetical protein
VTLNDWARKKINVPSWKVCCWEEKGFGFNYDEGLEVATKCYDY